MGVPALKSVVVQCVSVDAIELNLCSDDTLHLESCVVQAMCSIGFLRLFKVGDSFQDSSESEK